MKAAPALLERAGRVRYLLADKDYDRRRWRRLPGGKAGADGLHRRCAQGQSLAPAGA